MEVLLKRFAYTPFGTFGRLEVWDMKPGRKAPVFSCDTVERAWLNNERNISCIPTGRYLLKPAIHHISTPDPDDDYPCYEITGVPGRSAIHIHVANLMRHLAGCVGLGQFGLRILNGQPEIGVWSSRDTFNAFMGVMSGVGRAYITVKDAVPYDWS